MSNIAVCHTVLHSGSSSLSDLASGIMEKDLSLTTGEIVINHLWQNYHIKFDIDQRSRYHFHSAVVQSSLDTDQMPITANSRTLHFPLIRLESFAYMSKNRIRMPVDSP